MKKQEKGLQVSIADMNRELELLKSDSDAVITQLQSDIKDKQSAMSSLEKERSDFRADLDRKDTELVQRRRDIDDLRDKLRASDSLRSEVSRSSNEVARLKDQLQELKGNSSRQEEILRNELGIERRVVADLEKKLAHRDSSAEKRMELAKESLEAEIKTLKSELAFAKSDHESKVKTLQGRSEDDQRTSERQLEAKLAAQEAEWQTKWAVREAEYEEEKNAELAALEKKLFGGKREVRATIADLSNRLSMLKNGSDSQIRELEAELAAQQYRLTLKESGAQERLIEAQRQWSARMAAAEKIHMEELAQQKRTLSEDFLAEKKELRETVIDLTRQFSELRDNTKSRVKVLEAEVEKKDYKLSLLENRSEQDLLGTEEKWQAKLAAIDEKRQRELLEQKRDMQDQFLLKQDTLQAAVSELTRQIDVMREQHKLDLALKEEGSAAELALLERKYQDKLSTLKIGKSGEVEGLASKIKWQQDLIDGLKAEKSDLIFELDQRERALAKYRASVDALKKETTMTKLTQSEKMRLSKQSLESRIENLSVQLEIAKARIDQERQEIEEKWKVKLSRNEAGFRQKLKLQRQNLEEEVAALENTIGILRKGQGAEMKEMHAEFEDNQSIIRMLSKEKYEIADNLEAKSREIVRLNEEIIGLKDDLEAYKDLIPSASLRTTTRDKNDGQALASSRTRYDRQNTTKKDYYNAVRSAILSRFKKFDFSDYEGKEGVVKIDFELFANGSPKKGPEFFGTKDEGLKDLLNQCFEDALPFPPFPENLGKESQRFSLGISFKKK